MFLFWMQPSNALIFCFELLYGAVLIVFTCFIAKWMLRLFLLVLFVHFAPCWHISLVELLVCLSACFFVFWHYISNCLLALFFAILLCTACLIFVPKTSLFICFVCCRFSLMLLAGFAQFSLTDFASCCDTGFRYASFW